MSDQFVAEIRIFPFNFAPKSWAFCNGQLLPIAQNTALFSLLGTTYGGDGKTTFGLPNMQGNAPVQPGQGGGLSSYQLGQQGGVQSVTLQTSQIPLHPHTLRGNFNDADTKDPSANRALAASSPGKLYQSTTNSSLTNMSPSALAPAGGGLPHNNMMPYLTFNYCIALQGIFPPRP